MILDLIKVSVLHEVVTKTRYFFFSDLFTGSFLILLKIVVSVSLS